MAQVSLILTVYNVEQYIRQCLDSIINQTFKDIEIILVNDCSTDNSVQIIKEYQQKDSRIILLNMPTNQGISKARNEGMKIATGKYMVFADPDDWVREDYIEFLFNNIEKNNYDVFAAGFTSYNNKTSKYVHNKYSLLTTKCKNNKILILFPSIICCTWSKIYRRDFLLKNNLYFTLKKRDDCFFFYELIIANPKITFNNEPIYFYRIEREDSLTYSSYHKIHNIIILIKEIYKTLNKKNVYAKYCKVFYIYAFVYIAYGLTCSHLSTKRTKYSLFTVKRFLFSNNHNKINASDKFVAFIFKFFLNHARLYKAIAFILKSIRRLLSLFEKF